MSIGLILVLLFIHWLCDFTHLSRNYMLEAKRIGNPLSPILDHAFLHAAFMTGICSIYYAILPHPQKSIYLLFVLFIELITHFIIDALKGKLNVWVPSIADPKNKYHWYIFGLDQLLHVYVIVWIVSLIS